MLRAQAHSGRTHHFSFDDKEAWQGWIQAITTAINESARRSDRGSLLHHLVNGSMRRLTGEL